MLSYQVIYKNADEFSSISGEIDTKLFKSFLNKYYNEVYLASRPFSSRKSKNLLYYKFLLDKIKCGNSFCYSTSEILSKIKSYF